jgi:hypothetical protein
MDWQSFCAGLAIGLWLGGGLVILIIGWILTRAGPR